jgi:spore germination protein YaaH
MARTTSETREPPVRSGVTGTVLATAAIALVGILAVVAVGLFWPRGERVRNGPPIVVSGWAPYWQPDSALASFADNAELFGEVSLVAYSARGVDQVVAYEGVADGVLDTYRRAAASNGAPLVATVFDDTKRGEMAAILADPASRARHVDALVELVEAGGFDALELDYEGFAFVDDRSTWATTRPAWIALLTDLVARLRPAGVSLMVAVPPQYDDDRTGASGYWVYDYAAMGQLVDRIRIMAYDYSFSEPGPVAPIEWVERVVESAAQLVDPAKLDLGIPTYGYEWVTARTGTCPAGDDRERRPISIARMGRELASRGLTPTWDDTTAEVTFEYSETLTGDDGNGVAVTCTVTRVVYAPDARSVHRRAMLAYRNDFHGVALWALGNDDDATWDALGAAQRGEPTWPAVAVDTTTAGT